MSRPTASASGAWAKRARIGVRRRVGHPRVPVPQQHDLVVADHGGCGRELAAADRADVGADLGRVERGVEDLAFLPAGRRHEHRVHALGVVARDRSRTLRRLVVRVGVHGEKTETIPHGNEDTARDRRSDRPGPPAKTASGRRMLTSSKAAAAISRVRERLAKDRPRIGRFVSEGASDERDETPERRRAGEGEQGPRPRRGPPRDARSLL